MQRPRVLLVDDDLDMLEYLEAALAQDYETARAGNGREALAHVAARPFDIMVLDLEMPEVDGLQTLGALRERGVKLPVLLASSMPDLETTAERHGANAWLSKPFSLAAFLLKVRQIAPAPHEQA